MGVIDQTRVYSLNNYAEEARGDICYWMTREQRLEDNWALNYACLWAAGKGRHVRVFFFLPPRREGFAEKAYSFMVRGIIRLCDQARYKGLSFSVMAETDPVDFFRRLESRGMIGGLVCDFHPLRNYRMERERAARLLAFPVREVDGHNIIPCRHVSHKQEFAAYTLRSKIEPLLTKYLVDIPPYTVPRGCMPASEGGSLSPGDLMRTVPPVNFPLGEPGYEEGMGRLFRFLDEKWEAYGKERNNPVRDALSGLSPYLHFGQIAPQTAAFEAARRGGVTSLKGGFLDELIVRRELSDNFCWHNREYDSIGGFPPWARQTLALHEGDRREFLYDVSVLEEGDTHDDLWNAAQHQMVRAGKMHGFLRMYWAKKILEWSPTPAAAMERAVMLNDKYSLDGEDPNGYAGCAWAVGGLHDRAWQERPVYGKIRYMNYRGCRRKFPVGEYIRENLKDG